MHDNSRRLITEFVGSFPEDARGRVLDVGSQDINGNIAGLWHEHGWQYTGLDIVAGLNVDVVAEPYSYPFAGGAFDVVMSVNVAEHVEDVPRWFVECARVLRPGGLLCVVTPNKIAYHAYPIDCWRIMKDGMAWLLRRSGLEIVTCDHVGIDTIGIGRKPAP